MSGTLPQRESWATKIGILFATASWGIGLGNIWRFPYLTGEYGGASFLLVYILISVIIGIPCMVIEYNLGRESQSSPITGNFQLTRNPIWRLGGIFGIIGGLMIFSYYVMIIGWVLAYFVNFIPNTFGGMDITAIGQHFDALCADSTKTLAYEAVVLIFLGVVVSAGLVKGVERVAKYGMPTLAILFILLAIYSLTLPGAFKGVEFFLVPDFSKMNGQGFLAALGQAFLSIGVGQGASWVYASYMKKTDDVPTMISQAVFMNIAVGILVGLIIFPAAFAVGVNPDSGFSLLFKTLPSIFNTLPGGHIVGLLFFFGVLIAAITSAIAFAECFASTLMDSLKWDRTTARRKATWIVIAFSFLLSLPSVLANGPLKDVRWFGMDMFTFMDYVSANVFLILAGLIMCLYTGWSRGFERFKDEANTGATRVHVRNWWKPLILYVIPIVIAINFIAANF